MLDPQVQGEEEEEEEGGCKRYPSHLPARRCNDHPREPAANPRMSPGVGDGAGKRPSSPPPRDHPGEWEGVDSLFARAGWRRCGGAGWARWGPGTLPAGAPRARDTPLLSPPGCSHPRRLQDAREKRFSRR